MDVSFLTNFLLIADSGSIAEAARRIGITPAAVAQQVQSLEREFGVELLVRSGRTVMPSEAGYRVIARARSLIHEFLALKAIALEDDAAGELRIGTITTALLSLMPDVLSSFADSYPNAKVLIRAGTSMELFDALQRADIDLAVCLHPAFVLPKAYGWHLLREEPIVVLAHASLASCDPHELLKRQSFIRYDRLLGGGKQADQYLHAAKIVPRELFELNSLMAIAMMVDRGLGVSLVPDIVSPLTIKLNIAKLALPVRTEPRRFGVLWNRASPRGHLIKGFLARADAVLEAEIESG
jgi:DNA-binding transcriptional LysR family regulator